MEKINNQVENEQSPAITSTIGNFLRAQREKCGLSREEVSSRTKINLTMISLLEDDKLKTLPSRAYVTGYVKAYCKELDASIEEAMKYLDSTYRSMDVAKHGISAVETFYAKEGPVTNYSKHVLIVAIIGIFLGFGYYLFNQDNGPKAKQKKIIPPEPLNAQPPRLKAFPKKNAAMAATPMAISTAATNLAVAAATPTHVAAIAATAIATPTAIPVLKATPLAAILPILAPLSLPTPTSTASSSTKQAAAPNVKMTKFPENTFEIAKDADSLALSKTLPEGVRLNNNKELENVYVQAVNGDTWLTYKVAEKPVVKSLIKQGESLVLRGEEIRIFFGNVNVTRIWYNNQLIKTPSVSGVKSLVFPASAQNKYSIPLFIYRPDGTVETSDEYIKSLPATAPTSGPPLR